MNALVFPLLMAGQQAAGEGSAGPGSFITSLLPFAAIIAIFYFLIIRPQNRKQKETQKMLSTLKKGDRVVTIGGVHGTIQSVRESTVIVKVDENCKMEYSRSAISSVEAVSREDKGESKDDDAASDAGDASENEKK